MGTIAVRAYFADGQRIPSSDFVGKLFALFPQALADTGIEDDIRVAVRFHSEGIDVDLSSHHPIRSRDTSINRLATSLREFFRRHNILCDIHLLRPGRTGHIAPISTLPTPR